MIELERIIYRCFPVEKHVEKKRFSDSLVFYVKGKQKFDFGNCIFEAEEGDMFYIPFESKYTNYVLSKETEYYQIDFKTIKNGVYRPLFSKPRLFKMEDAIQYAPIFKKVHEMYSIRDTAYDFFCTSDVIKLIGMIIQKDASKKELYGVKKIAIAITFINEHYFLDTSVEDLAKMCSTSVSNFEKNFKKYIGISPVNYRNKIRVEKAGHFLACGYSIEDTAYKVGYANPYYFSSVFKKYTGTTPGRFSKNNDYV